MYACDLTFLLLLESLQGYQSLYNYLDISLNSCAVEFLTILEGAGCTVFRGIRTLPLTFRRDSHSRGNAMLKE